MNCKHCRRQFADLLLSPGSPAAAQVRSHIAACASCAAQLHALRRTHALLDEFAAPEPSPYFATRLNARLRQAAQEQPAGLLERLRLSLRYSYNLHLRPLAAVAALAVVSFGGLSGYHAYSNRPVQTSSTVQELQTLDGNEQTISQMMQLADGSNDDNPGSAAQLNP